MSAPADAAGMAQFVTRLRLVDEDVVRDAVAELDDKSAPPKQLLDLFERRGLLTPLQTRKLAKGETDGYFYGGYRMRYRISSGSFGRVYRGDDPRTGQSVAIKILRNRFAEDARRVASFEREGKLGLTMRHPNVVGILAVGKDQPTLSHYIVMEFVEGMNLRDNLTVRKKYDVGPALKIMEECVAGLAYANERGLTHRDIKPSNILIATDGTAKLVDFGLAETSQGAAMFSGGKPGEKEEQEAADRTVDYAGLEKATSVKSGDVRSDIYFLGHVLFEMIAGEPLMPATRDRHTRMSRRRFEEVETTLAKRGPEIGLPASVQRLMTRAVAFEPMRRFQKPEQFLEALKDARAELAPPEEDAGPARPPGPLTVFVVEQHPKLQDVFRDKLKKAGFRVLMSADAAQAKSRYQSEPYHALVVDAGTAGDVGVRTLQGVLQDADAKNQQVAGVLILNENQAAAAADLDGHANAVALVRPVTLGQLTEKLRELVPESAQAE